MHVTRAVRIAALSLLTLTAIGGARSIAAKPGPPAYAPRIVAADFQTTIDNPYLPLVPGTTFKFIETEGKRTSEDEVAVTRDTRVIMGVTCVVVRDVVTQGGALHEETFDWYAQDKKGNVWYFGEDTKEHRRDGTITTEGSWEAGVDGAQPGIVMWASPRPDKPYRQEYYAGRAEDMGQIEAVGDSVTVPLGTFKGCVRTRDWSTLERDVEHKWYAKGVGVVRTESRSGEIAVLVSMTRP